MAYYSTIVSTTFTLLSGTYTDEQGLLASLDSFIVDTVGGWNRLKVVTDTATDKNIAYYTDGSAGFYDRLYVRLRATSDEVQLNGLSFFDSTGDVDADQFGGTGITTIPAGTTSGTYWFLANEDAVHVVVTTAAGDAYHGGFGCWATYYSRAADPKPLYVFGQTAQEQTFQSDLRLLSFGPKSWGTSYAVGGVAISGSAQSYEAAHPASVVNGSPNARTGQPCFMEPIFYTDALFQASEVRGEVPGLYMCGGAPYIHGNVVTISGTRSPAGAYLIHKHTDALAWALGPITQIEES